MFFSGFIKRKRPLRLYQKAAAITHNSQRRLGSVTKRHIRRLGGLYAATSSCRNLHQVTQENVFGRAWEKSILMPKHTYSTKNWLFEFEYIWNTNGKLQNDIKIILLTCTLCLLIFYLKLEKGLWQYSVHNSKSRLHEHEAQISREMKGQSFFYYICLVTFYKLYLSYCLFGRYGYTYLNTNGIYSFYFFFFFKSWFPLTASLTRLITLSCSLAKHQHFLNFPAAAADDDNGWQDVKLTSSSKGSDGKWACWHQYIPVHMPRHAKHQLSASMHIMCIK